ncbi:unnamed protein product [Rotaria sp. Silwood2]|nr:unnamed protein product [Rotaria sp. Silwood2]CAF4578546.1 unnamed protein product [Rotaria sp. Silwood2]CAF4683797.1 unnamed protein product [Rotaria sp. Silwood2]
MLRLYLYTGKEGKSEHGLYTHIALDLLELYKLGFNAVGTVRPNRLPGLIMKNEKDFSLEERGAIDHCVAEVDGVQICAMKWYDNNIVNCLSTLHACHPVDFVQRCECLALYRRHSSGQKIPKKNIMSLLKFRVNVAAALLQCNPSSSPTAKRGRPSLQSIISDQTSPKSSGATPNPLPSKNIRMDRFTH